MKNLIVTREKIQVNIADEVVRFMFKVGIVLTALIGIGGVSCLIAGLTSVGPLQLVKGYITAITGF
jgi:hypothetical protein